MSDLRREVLELLLQVAGRDVPADESVPLFDGGLGLDSLALLELVVAIDERWGARARPDEAAAAFRTLGTLTAFVAAHRTGDRE